MITGKDIYDVLAAIVPLYVAMLLAYGSVRWWKIFTPDQCSGINRFVAVFAVPLLSFHFISTNNPYAMNYRFIAADSLQKLVILVALLVWHNLGRRHASNHTSSLDWTITLFSLATLPNTLVMGIPLLRAMYGDFSGSLMVQIVVLQSVIWYTLMLFMFEYRGARALIADQFPPDVTGSITSFRIDSDVTSLNGRQPLQADAQLGRDGKLHVVVRRSASSSTASTHKNSFAASMTPRASNLTGVEIYSVQSSREPTPRGSSFNQADFYAMFSGKVTSPRGGAPPSLGLDEEMNMRFSARLKGPGSKSCELINHTLSNSSSSYPAPNPVLSATSSLKKNPNPNPSGNSKELHMYVWSSSASPGSEVNMRHAINRAASVDSACVEAPALKVYAPSENASAVGKVNGDHVELEDGMRKNCSTPNGKNIPIKASSFTREKKAAAEGPPGLVEAEHPMPPASVMTRLILIMVWRKLIRNPNTYSSLIGLIWSLVSFRFNIEMPLIVKGSISILSDAGLGMAMFSLGLFMALQPKIIACGKSVATFAMAVRFLTGPAVMAATSIAIGLRGVLLHVAIIQAALPQGIVPFVFAKEYNCHPDILSTAVIFGMLIALPITILYYALLGV